MKCIFGVDFIGHFGITGKLFGFKFSEISTDIEIMYLNIYNLDAFN